MARRRTGPPPAGRHRALEITDAHPWQEVVQYLSVHRHAVETVLHTLSYVDGINFARRATAPALFSVGLRDMVCPPSTVFAAFNHYGGEKEIAVYPFNGHEGGDGVHVDRQLGWLGKAMSSPLRLGVMQAH